MSATTEQTPAPSPREDLYRHVNAEWLATHEIPADQGAYGAFLELRDAAELAVRHLAEDAVREGEDAPADRRRVAALYRSFMDEETVAARGLEPLAGDLAAAAAVSSPEELLHLSGRLQREGVSGLVNTGALNDAGRPERMLLHLLQGGLGLPDEAYYREEAYADILAHYTAHVGAMFALAGVGADEAESVALGERVVALEKRIAAVHWDLVRTRDAVARYNLMPRARLLELFPLAPAWLDGVGAQGPRSEEVVVWQPDFLAGVQELLQGPDAADLADWRHWLTLQILRSFAAYLPEPFVQESFSFYGRRLAGSEQPRPRWKRAVSFVNAGVGEDVGRLYVARHFPEGHREAMDELVSLLLEAYRRSIGELEWMGEQTRQRALEKLAMFRPMVGHPTAWRDYSALELDPTDLVGNARATARFEWDRDLAKLEDGPDPDEWHMTPQTVNAYYSPLENVIVFPAAILQPPFFDPQLSMASNLGSIGAVIGHEIGHGFDDQGSRYDGAGRLHDWWTPADREAFAERTARLVDQYSRLCPAEAPERTVNGEFTLGENIGDLGGLGIAYRALEIWREEQDADSQDTAAGDREFFTAWAAVWRQLTRPEAMVTRIASDPHSPNEFRCNQVAKNLDAFHAAYGTQEGDPMWLAPEERVVIW
ncbi:M13 family metallopeptidase [Micrococcus sp.]|uniref:M13 family metallopeptidase n=1 Tax=Micrococcus sp. TaxID=1271 RepID=UPI002A908657|nr:M13 family metallopeptidase [Micrococcus sp.]MDY6056049.1 M13 family metallopeptidase [Micrococcus sp.]